MDDIWHHGLRVYLRMGRGRVSLVPTPSKYGVRGSWSVVMGGQGLVTASEADQDVILDYGI